MHRELTKPQDVQEFVTTFEQEHRGTWKEAQSRNRDVADAWDARTRLIEDQTALNRPSDALRCYQAAASSAVPHLDWQANLEAGIRDAEKAVGASYAPASKP